MVSFAAGTAADLVDRAGPVVLAHTLRSPDRVECLLAPAVLVDTVRQEWALEDQAGLADRGGCGEGPTRSEAGKCSSG